MNTQQISRHHVRIDQQHAPALTALARQGGMTATNEHLCGMPRGRVYVPAAGHLAAQQALDAGHLALGPVRLAAEIYRLPTLEEVALQRQSPQFTALPGHDELIARLAKPMTDRAQVMWVRDLINSVMSGPEHPRVACGGELEDTTWLMDRTRLVELQGRWFLSLAFRLPACAWAGHGQPFGLDVGLHPLAVASAAQGRQTVRARPLHLLTGAGLRALEREIGRLPLPQRAVVEAAYSRAQYAAARTALEAFTGELLGLASRVTAERLDLRSFQGPFVARGRALAVIDWHQSWLPQTLYRCGVPLQRVHPALTSQLCAQCGVRGTRHGDVLTCQHCGNADAHENAARNLLRRGQGAAYRRRPAGGRAGPM